MPKAGELVREVEVAYSVSCGDCGARRRLRVMTAVQAAELLRGQQDWSKGRDKVWRCHRCRPRRFGERVNG